MQRCHWETNNTIFFKVNQSGRRWLVPFMKYSYSSLHHFITCCYLLKIQYDNQYTHQLAICPWVQISIIGSALLALISDIGPSDVSPSYGQSYMEIYFNFTLWKLWKCLNRRARESVGCQKAISLDISLSKMMIHQLMIASILMVGIVRGTSIGAPHTCCEEMVPGHGVPAQNGTSSFLTIPHLVSSSTMYLIIKFFFKIYLSCF